MRETTQPGRPLTLLPQSRATAQTDDALAAEAGPQATDSSAPCGSSSSEEGVILSPTLLLRPRGHPARWVLERGLVSGPGHLTQSLQLPEGLRNNLSPQ